MLAMTCGAESWFDDVTLRKTKLPDPPIRAYPQLAKALRDAADRLAVKVATGTEITLQAKDGCVGRGSGIRGDQSSGRGLTQLSRPTGC